MDISIYLKSTGQIIQTRNVVGLEEIQLTDEYGYIEGRFTPHVTKWNGTKVVDYTPPVSAGNFGYPEPPTGYVSGDNEAKVRFQRNMLLGTTDWTQLPDSPLTDAKKAEWATYRQQLRDMMSSYTDSESNTVENTTFPTPPE